MPAQKAADTADPCEELLGCQPAVMPEAMLQLQLWSAAPGHVPQGVPPELARFSKANSSLKDAKANGAADIPAELLNAGVIVMAKSCP